MLFGGASKTRIRNLEIPDWASGPFRNDGTNLRLGRRAGFHQLVDHRIHQRLKRRVDDIG
jgi:hypothetical protein